MTQLSPGPVRQKRKNPTPREVLIVECANCGESFDRGYTIAIERKSKPQYCSRGCLNARRREEADARAAARFWSKVSGESESECWEWTGHKTKLGYGRVNFKPGFTMLAHRVAYYLVHGNLPSDTLICHNCDNPGCVNPKHLFMGSHADNTADMMAKGRHRYEGFETGENHPSARLTKSQAQEVFLSDRPAKELAAEYGISATAIRYIWSGKNWASATRELRS